MKVFMIGGTGLLGSEAAKVLIERGHEVTSVALPPLPQGAVLPPEMKIEYEKSGDTVFDGTVNTFIDTNVNLYTSDTIDKDFENRFKNRVL